MQAWPAMGCAGRGAKLLLPCNAVLMACCYRLFGYVWCMSWNRDSDDEDCLREFQIKSVCCLLLKDFLLLLTIYH
jgi:hypothetical protein